ncbi:hypothetical protein [uncultured Mailhella sp.]|uniref:hypothetical protein n=1 Tax=uncultured Mailhella sp. TaxID=1981031 RepID=UPI0025CF1A6C|nr:hypothetical protein [uncultured Mailhella sp.]
MPDGSWRPRSSSLFTSSEAPTETAFSGRAGREGGGGPASCVVCFGRVQSGDYFSILTNYYLFIYFLLTKTLIGVKPVP